jgi:hypothetical protein
MFTLEGLVKKSGKANIQMQLDSSVRVQHFANIIHLSSMKSPKT